MIQIDEKVCEDVGLTKEEVIILIALDIGNDDVYENLIAKGLITKYNETYYQLYKKYSVVNKARELVNHILVMSNKTIANQKTRFDELAEKLRGIYPEGKMPGTPYYYKGNMKDISKKLMSFFKRYGDKYSDEEIVEATQSYVNSFNGDYTFMKLLKYFIWKNEIKDGEVVINSSLADYLENKGQSDINNNWTFEMR